MIIFLIISVAFGLAINMVMNAKKAEKGDEIIQAQIKTMKAAIVEIKKFVNMPEPVEPPEEE